MDYHNAAMMYKMQRSECYVCDKNSIGDNTTTPVAVTVDVEKFSGENKKT